MHLFDNVSYSITPLEKNKYYRERDYKYVKITDNFVPSSKQDILNIYYTVVNSGMDKFTFYCDKSRNNKFMVKLKTDRKKFTDKLKKLSRWLYDHRTMGVVEIVKRVNLSLVGHYNYFGVTSNGRSINCFCYRIKKILFKVLNRRSQRKSYTWEKFNNLLKKFPLAKPKICVQLP